MELSRLKPGDKVRTVDGAVVEILKESEDGRWVAVRYVSGTEDPKLIGTQDLCHEDELTETVEVAGR